MEVISLNIFCWVMGIVIAILFIFFIPILINVIGLRGDLKPVGNLVSQVDDFLKKSGLEGIKLGLEKTKKTEHHSLPLEKQMERDQLLVIGNEYGLDSTQAERLKELLEEDARDDFKKGVVNTLALGAIIIAVSAIIKGLSKKT